MSKKQKLEFYQSTCAEVYAVVTELTDVGCVATFIEFDDNDSQLVISKDLVLEWHFNDESITAWKKMTNKKMIKILKTLML